MYRASRFLDRSDFNRVILDDGSDLQVPARALRVQDDGAFLLVEEMLPHPPPTEKTAEPHLAEPAEISFDEPLFVENAQVERVPVNRIVDGPVATRREGDVTIIPVVEEVVLVEKKLLLKEEIRVTRQRSELTQPRRVMLTQGESKLIGADGRSIEREEGR